MLMSGEFVSHVLKGVPHAMNRATVRYVWDNMSSKQINPVLFAKSIS